MILAGRIVVLLALLGAPACAKSDPSSQPRQTREDTDDEAAQEPDDEELGGEGGERPTDESDSSGDEGDGDEGDGDEGRQDGGPHGHEPVCDITADCTEDIARTLCMQDCKVCVQSVDAAGNPLHWLVMHNVAYCDDCPEPYLEHPWEAPDGGVWADAGLTED